MMEQQQKHARRDSRVDTHAVAVAADAVSAAGAFRVIMSLSLRSTRSLLASVHVFLSPFLDISSL